MSWIKTFELALEAQKLLPMWGHVPPFPWISLSETISSWLGHSVTLKPGAADWREETATLSGLGADPTIISLELTPLQKPLFLAMPKIDLSKLLSMLLKDTGPGLNDATIRDAFFQFATLELLSKCGSVRPAGDLTPKLAEHSFAPCAAYTIDVAIECPDQTLWARLISPADFHAEFRKHFANKPIDLRSHPMADSINISLALEIGSTTLSNAKWKMVNVGDFLILDHCSYMPKEQKGSILMTLGSKPLFQARLKEGETKILDYAHHFEEKVMENNEDEPIIDDTSDEETMASEPPPTHTEHQDLINADDVPMQITVEVGRMHMPLSDVLALAPGNVLDLAVRPEEGVTLTVGGKPIAKGELLAIGDVLGVKLSDVG